MKNAIIVSGIVFVVIVATILAMTLLFRFTPTTAQTLVQAQAQAQAQISKSGADIKSNPVVETIMARRSIRAYKDTPVARELLDRIAECGINAPNGMNAQQWEVRIVDSKQWIDNATEAYRSTAKGTPAEKAVADPKFKNMFRNAPAVIFIAHKPSPCTQVDCGLMAGNMVLAAQSLGLGSVCMMGPVGFFSTPQGAPLLRSLGLSDGYELLLCIGIGYADEQPDAKPRKSEVIKYVE